MLRLRVVTGSLVPPRTQLVQYFAFVSEKCPDLLQHLRMIRAIYRRDLSRDIIFDIGPVIPM